MADVRAEFDDGHWRVVDSDGRRWAAAEIVNINQIGGQFVDYHDVTDYGWDEGTRIQDEHTAQLVAGALQLWVNEVAARERAAEQRANNMASVDELADALGECFNGYTHSMATMLLARFVVIKKSI